MPTYDYQCQACGHEFEKFHSITAKPIKTCPECKKRQVKRLIGTGAGIIFKGSGFYQTDYRSESYKQAAANDKPKAETKSSDSSKAGEKSDKAQPKAKPADS